MEWNIIADSSCDLLTIEQDRKNIRYSTVPFTINIKNAEYVDDETLDTGIMLTEMENYASATQTSCPSPKVWYEQFEKSDKSIAITISSQLSGSYNSAFAARKMMLEKHPFKKIAVIDSRSAGPELVLIVRKIYELVEKQLDFEAVITEVQDYIQTNRTVFALSSFSNLVKNGRMSKLAGFIAGTLGIWGIGVDNEGKIRVKKKVRGLNHVLSALIEDMEERGYSGSTVVISHCHNACLAQRLYDKIKEMWQTAEITIMPTRGLCSYYAERSGLIVAF